MEIKQPLLSICIPTYNRASILDRSLKSITSDRDFNDDVEIVISDNCSPDDTRIVCEKYTSKYHNVHYFCNEENVRDRNFLLVLNRANGKYLKILNDTCYFKVGMLGYMKNKIRECDESKVILFPSFSYFTKKACDYEFRGKDKALYYLSYNATWTPTYGMWRKDIKDICSDSDFSTKLAQVTWIYKMVEEKGVLLCFNDYFHVTMTSSKGNYNYMNVFVNNYLGILKTQKLKFISIEREKFRLLFMLSSFYYFMNVSKSISYNSKGAFKVMYKEYWYEPYFYVLFPSYLFMRFIYEKFLKAIRYKQ